MSQSVTNPAPASSARYIAPRINRNGTNPQELMNVRQFARQAIDNALKALLDCNPHGRDYQTEATNERYELARATYAERDRQLQAMYDELMQEMIAIDEQRQR
jgi:hypothetical protein